MNRSSGPVVIHDAIAARLDGFAVSTAAVTWIRIPIITDLSYFFLHNSVSADLGFYLTGGATSITGECIAVIAKFARGHVDHSVSACLVGCAVQTAAISAYHISIIANLTLVDDTITTAADVDANRLVGRALLAFLAP